MLKDVILLKPASGVLVSETCSPTRFMKLVNSTWNGQTLRKFLLMLTIGSFSRKLWVYNFSQTSFSCLQADWNFLACSCAVELQDWLTNKMIPCSKTSIRLQDVSTTVNWHWQSLVVCDRILRLHQAANHLARSHFIVDSLIFGAC